MKKSRKEWQECFERKFRPAFYEIEYLKNKIDKKQGLWFFKVHQWTTEQLLESKHHRKINSIVEKIGSDVDFWLKNNELSKIGKTIYLQKRKEIEEALHQTNLLIQKRQPTFWEDARDTLTQFVDKVMEKLPIPNFGLLGGGFFGLFNPVKQIFLPASKK